MKRASDSDIRCSFYYLLYSAKNKGKARVIDMSAKKKMLWLAAIIVLAAIIIVICVSVFTRGPVDEFDGTLVNLNYDFPKLI